MPPPANIGLDRDVAVKVIAPELVDDPLTRERFVGEARAAGAVEHPNIVPVHAVGVDHEHAFLVMRYVAGEDLRALRTSATGRSRPRPRTRSCAQLGAALDAIHAAWLRAPRRQAAQRHGRGGRARVPDRLRTRQGTRWPARVRPRRSTGSGRPTSSRPSRSAGGRWTRGPMSTRSAASSSSCSRAASRSSARPTRRSCGPNFIEPAPLPSAARPGLPPALDTVVRRALAKDPQLRQPTRGRARRGGPRRRARARGGGDRGGRHAAPASRAAWRAAPRGARHSRWSRPAAPSGLAIRGDERPTDHGAGGRSRGAREAPPLPARPRSPRRRHPRRRR